MQSLKGSIQFCQTIGHWQNGHSLSDNVEMRSTSRVYHGAVTLLVVIKTMDE